MGRHGLGQSGSGQREMAVVINIQILTTLVAIQADLHIRRLYWRHVDAVNVYEYEALLQVNIRGIS
jgi:hypothetical protein